MRTAAPRGEEKRTERSQDGVKSFGGLQVGELIVPQETCGSHTSSA